MHEWKARRTITRNMCIWMKNTCFKCNFCGNHKSLPLIEPDTSCNLIRENSGCQSSISISTLLARLATHTIESLFLTLYHFISLNTVAEAAGGSTRTCFSLFMDRRDVHVNQKAAFVCPTASLAATLSSAAATPAGAKYQWTAVWHEYDRLVL